MKYKEAKFGKGLKKYYRWLRLYIKRVRVAEQEIGGELQAC